MGHAIWPKTGIRQKAVQELPIPGRNSRYSVSLAGLVFPTSRRVQKTAAVGILNSPLLKKKPTTKTTAAARQFNAICERGVDAEEGKLRANDNQMKTAKETSPGIPRAVPIASQSLT